MPGIVGLITRLPPAAARAQLASMVTAICHESTYESDTWADEALGVYVGWVARKDSFASQMPVLNEDGSRVLVFSGEEYPDPGIVCDLKRRGHVVESDGPSYLVHVAEEDPAFPESLNGRFHGILVDQRRGVATLFNDRYGIHRLYWHQSGDAFYFAAEAKAILEVRPELRSVDARGLGELVACGCVLEDRTVFKNIHVLPPASSWKFVNGEAGPRGRYFEPRQWEEQAISDPETYYRDVRDVFTRNLPRYFKGRESVAVSLTGGLDTRMIMAWHRPEAGTLPCYSFGGMYRDSEDVRVARRIAGMMGQSHEVLPVDSDFLSRFPHYAERTIHLTDGCTDVSFSPDLYVNERAAAIAPVRMTGNYGGEILRRVRAFKPVNPTPGLFRSEFVQFVNDAGSTYNGLLAGHPLSFAAFRQTPWHHYGLLALEQTQLSVRSPYLDNDFVRTVFRAPASALANDDLCLRLIGDGHPGLRSILTDRGHGGTGLSDAATRRVLEFTFKAEYAFDYGMPQWLAQLDRVASPTHPERLFLGRHKFKHFRVWYRDTLSSYVREMLLDRRTLTRPYLHREAVEAMTVRHVEGKGNYTREIHKILTLELLHRLFIDPR